MLRLPSTLLLALIAMAALAGCDKMELAHMRNQSRYYVKPAVAVVSFQASGGVHGWNVGSGLAEVLTDELIKTDRFQVVERPNIGDVVSELQMQQTPLMRAQGKSEIGRLKNVEYLIKGRVTDFGHVSSSDAWARMDMLNVFGQRYKAVLGLTFQVIEVESGRIVLSRSVESSVRAVQARGDAAYKGVSFGGSAFYRTPLGKVTADATRKAVREIVNCIASQPWQPRIALVQDARIVINGGEDRGLTVGELYRVTEHGEAILDPETGDRLDRLPGRQVGQLQVVEVHDRYAVAKSLTQSTYQVGQSLEPVRN